MAVFISSSSKDNLFANGLALELVKHGVRVWIDKWEIQVGDSLVDKIQLGLTNSSFLLVILSKNGAKRMV
jgi:hypothetical protein